MVGALLGFVELEPDADPAALACPSNPTGESNGGTVGVGVEVAVVAVPEESTVTAVVVAVAVPEELTVVDAVDEGVGVAVGEIVMGVTPGPAVVPKAGVVAGVETEVDAKTLGMFALPLLLPLPTVEP